MRARLLREQRKLRVDGCEQLRGVRWRAGAGNRMSDLPVGLFRAIQFLLPMRGVRTVLPSVSLPEQMFRQCHSLQLRLSGEGVYARGESGLDNSRFHHTDAFNSLIMHCLSSKIK
jgi:hypothetical protein